nr:hypothetical protein [Rhizobium laguerreae]
MAGSFAGGHWGIKRAITLSRAGATRPRWGGAEGMIEEEVPGAVFAFAVNLHAVMMDLDRPAILVLPRDQPLRACHGEIARDGRVVGDDVHMRSQADIGGHGRADGIGAAGDGSATMHLVDLHDRGIGVIKGGCGFNIQSVESPGEPEVAEFGTGRTHGISPFLLSLKRANRNASHRQSVSLQFRDAPTHRRAPRPSRIFPQRRPTGYR